MKKKFSSIISPIENPLLYVGGLIFTAGYWIAMASTNPKMKMTAGLMMAFGIGITTLGGGT